LQDLYILGAVVVATAWLLYDCLRATARDRLRTGGRGGLNLTLGGPVAPVPGKEEDAATYYSG
jgi:hypothetical protein